MPDEAIIRQQVQNYLEGLGYSRYQISSEARTNYNERIDFVIYVDGAPYAIAEIKANEQLSNAKASDDLRFNPVVRQTQSYAASLNAPFYLVTDGTSFRWFTTNDSGHPELLKNPVMPSRHRPIMETDVVRLFEDLRDFFFRSGVTALRDEAAIVIFAKLLYEQGDHRLIEGLVNSYGAYNPSDRSDLVNVPLQKILQISYSTRSSGHFGDERMYYARVFELINQISFKDVTQQALLRALDKVFIGEQNQHDGPRVPRWQADFLVLLSQVQTNDMVLDIYSNYGDIAAAVLWRIEQNQSENLVGISPNATSALWAQIQQLILSNGSNTNNILIGNVPPYDRWHGGRRYFSEEKLEPTKIIVAPPFGARVDEREVREYIMPRGTSQSEDLYLELAMNWVQQGGRVTAIIPEGLLVSVNRRSIRELILMRMRITAIISLGTFPGSRIKTSILVLDAKRDAHPYDIFLCHVGNIENANTFDSLTIPQLAEAFQAFEQWTIEKKLFAKQNVITISSDKLDIDNMAVSHYLVPNTANNEAISQYVTARLKELTLEITWGTKLTLDDKGPLQLIGPAMIRSMVLDPEAFDHTTLGKVEGKHHIAHVGDIVVNGIGNYAGSAALIEDNLDGTLVGQHVVHIRVDSSRIIPEFLAIAINSAFVRKQMQSMSGGSVITNLRIKSLPDIVIPVPEKSIQRFFIERMRKVRDEWFQAQYQLKEAERAFVTSIEDLSGWGLE